MCTVKYDKVQYYVFFIKTVYCRGSGFELLSAFLSLAVFLRFLRFIYVDYMRDSCKPRLISNFVRKSFCKFLNHYDFLNFVRNLWSMSLQRKLGYFHASPTFGHARKFKSLSLSISLENDSLYGL